jgi:transcriptional regulator with PAS, ATPase and Fis domain
MKSEAEFGFERIHSTEVREHPEDLLDKFSFEKLIEVLTDQVCDRVTESLEAVQGGIERRIILRVLEKTGGNKSEAAKLLGIKRTTLSYKIKKRNIHVPHPQRWRFR